MESLASSMPHQANLYQSIYWKLKSGLSLMESINNCIVVLADAGDSFSATAAAAATVDDGSGPPLPPQHAYETDPMRRADGVFHDNAGRAFIYDPPRYLRWVLGELKRNLKKLFPQSQVGDDGLLDEGPLYQAEDQLLELLQEITPITDDAPSICVDICIESLDLVNKSLFKCTDMEGFLLYGYKNTEVLQHVRERTGFDASRALVLSQEIVKNLEKAVTVFKQSAMIEWCKGLHRAYEAEKRAGTMGAQVFGRTTRDAKTSKLPEQESTSSEYENGAMPPNEIDEHLHSRQLAVYGMEAMRRLFTSNVLVSGLNGLGAEIAKNLALAGVKSVTLHDSKPVELWDLSGNFFLSEEDVGKNRAIACVAKLQDLNNAVLISALTEELTTEHLSKFQAVVFTDICLDKACEFDDYCHSHQPPIPFIKSEVCGLFGSVFCDFGPNFTVLDIDGEDAHTGIIASISNDSPALVSCVDDELLEFQDGDLVVFSEVDGMKELNDGKPRKVKNKGRTQC